MRDDGTANLDRQNLIDYLRLELIGPVGGPEERIQSDDPQDRYIMGVLYPQRASMEKGQEGEDNDDFAGAISLDSTDDPVALAGQWMPSAVGLSFFCKTTSLSITPWGAEYLESNDQPGTWIRRSLVPLDVPYTVTISPPDGRAWGRTPLFGGKAKLAHLWRKRGDGWLVTLTLLNERKTEGDGRAHATDCIFQAGFECRANGGTILQYIQADSYLRNEEDEELALLYRDAPVYAVGHGCAATWTVEGTQCCAVRTEFMPNYEVPGMTFEITGNSHVRQTAWLANPSTSLGSLIDGLQDFVAQYRAWIDILVSRHSDIPPRLHKARKRLLDRLSEAAGRMQASIDLIARDGTILQAFRLANLAMLMQAYHAQDSIGGKQKRRTSTPNPKPDYLTWTDHKWRPFQLAFQLLSLESVAIENSPYRKVVDLIWFPTGGGKTEAYLAVAAFEIFLRRLRYGNHGAGTTVITRYTLRLLTAQQFQRTTRLICACEIIRKQHQTLMGDEPITAGLWVGKTSSPNNFKEANKDYVALREAPKPESPYALELCPWCGTELVPQRRSDDSGDYGIRSTIGSFAFYCPSEGCEFHHELPISVVDEHLYKHPPTFLVGTVDKFAQLTWVAEAGAFFGGSNHLPPSLIIQDELHLLSGPLGTMAGLYESAIEAIIKLKGTRPKVIASTATIRSAADQVTGLFARDVRLFPSPGLTAADSYFAKTDLSKPGRMYVGVMSASHRPTTSLIRTSAGLLEGVQEVVKGSAEQDAYWTLIIYHNSLRELGKTITFAHDDIPARIAVIASDESNARKLKSEQVLELTSNITAEEIPASLKRIDRKKDQPDAVSLLASTNMISVGVDFQRLGLMMVNGQPKATSEYIQASSRVGRGQVPGLVVIHYSSSKPRDRSHYESFRSYHAALYRHVEPTSVTPFSLPARVRALHAALVVVIRHTTDLSGNDRAGDFRSESPGVVAAVECLLDTVGIVDPDEMEATRIELARLVNEWAQSAQLHRGVLHYDAKSPFVPLLKYYGAGGKGWPTLASMRNVDLSCNIDVLGEEQL